MRFLSLRGWICGDRAPKRMSIDYRELENMNKLGTGRGSSSVRRRTGSTLYSTRPRLPVISAKMGRPG
jgi:hypothetical protein